MNDSQQHNSGPTPDAVHNRGGAPGPQQEIDGRPHPAWDAFHPYAALVPRKRKWVVCLLSLLIPGTGHFYLGLMQKGLTVMLLIIMDIFAIVHFSINMSSIPLITLLALFLPIIYFYSLFDALLSTDKVNAYRYAPAPRPDGSPGEWSGEARNPAQSQPYIGWLLVAVGGLFFVFSAKPDWISFVLDKMGTMIGGMILIGIGLVLFLRKSKPK
ncbi:hypothetical protein [Paenibacillus flagellatus]|uniref:Uncharacterized protein n=1 Tax=Paenibacillus flagellatus TaxID=2211139 RepID=A0A2V5JXU2_9BACL|nr:hypothetical protein [Paenibacillus flagellatus]PYI51638.1 hypothetical protein DLM86_24850 [Paenibacillus flagellatus]